MAHIKMEYVVAVCESDLLSPDEKRCYLGDPNSYYGGCDENEGCPGYRQVPQIEKVLESGEICITVDNNCGYYSERTVYEEKTLKRFTAYENANTGWNAWWRYPYVLEAGGRKYPCRYLEIDGHVYCDERDRSKEEIEGEQS